MRRAAFALPPSAASLGAEDVGAAFCAETAVVLLYLSLFSGVVTNGSADDRDSEGRSPQASVESRRFGCPSSMGPTSASRVSTPSKAFEIQRRTFVQDDQGFVWFGTPYGLNRFDGYNFKVFTTTLEIQEH